MCIDYHALDNISMKKNYLLSQIDGLLNQFNGARYFNENELKLGYYQIQVTEEDVEMMILWTKYELYEFLVMRFGLCNVPQMFTTQMILIFHENLDDFLSFISMTSLCTPKLQKNMWGTYSMS